MPINLDRKMVCIKRIKQTKRTLEGWEVQIERNVSGKRKTVACKFFPIHKYVNLKGLDYSELSFKVAYDLAIKAALKDAQQFRDESFRKYPSKHYKWE